MNGRPSAVPNLNIFGLLMSDVPPDPIPHLIVDSDDGNGSPWRSDELPTPHVKTRSL